MEPNLQVINPAHTLIADTLITTTFVGSVEDSWLEANQLTQCSLIFYIATIKIIVNQWGIKSGQDKELVALPQHGNGPEHCSILKQTFLQQKGIQNEGPDPDLAFGGPCD